MQKSTIIFGVLAIILLVGCGNSNKKPFYQADISGIEKIEVTIGRYDRLLFEVDTNNMVEELQPHIDDYPFLNEEIYNPEGQQRLLEYITNPLNRLVYTETQKVWHDLDKLEGEISSAFRYYRYHFPTEAIPDIFAYISGVNEISPIRLFDNNTLVVGLDAYLGQDYEVYSKLGIFTYLTYKMQPAFVAPDLFRVLAEMHLGELSKVPESFLDFMIQEGKLLYFLDCMLPNHPDSIKIGYTRGQLEWMEINSGLVWAYFIENQMLYSSERQTIVNFVGEKPFTSVFGNDSPPRTAAYIGWQIVREYMRRNKEVTLPQLLANNNSQEILTKSKYRPRRQ